MPPFDFDPLDDSKASMPELENFDTPETDREHQQKRVVIRIDYDLCEATGVCAEVCPETVLEHVNGHTSVINADKCTECWLCVENCISGAIEIG